MSDVRKKKPLFCCHFLLSMGICVVWLKCFKCFGLKISRTWLPVQNLLKEKEKKFRSALIMHVVKQHEGAFFAFESGKKLLRENFCFSLLRRSFFFLFFWSWKLIFFLALNGRKKTHKNWKAPEDKPFMQ